jgi:GNAT superfamily N-acetyltransferase
VRRYGDAEGDSSPIDAAEFMDPNGVFVVVHDDGVPIGMGGWRRYGTDGVGEIRRMYVRESARGRGIARLLLAHLERTAVEAGIRRLVLETGTAQPEAIGLYRSSGYVDVEPFGHYVGYSDSVHLGRDLPATPDETSREGA